MNRRTFVKMAAGTTMLGAIPPIIASPDQGKTRAWPKTVSLDNPIGHPFPVKFVEEIPLVLRAHFWTNHWEKETEIFRFTAHEWMTDAVLFRGMEMKPRDPSTLCSQEFLDSKFNIYIEDYKALDGLRISSFIKEGGAAFPLRSDPTKCLSSDFRGWVDKDGWPDMDGYLGYFLPNKHSISLKIENSYKGHIAVEIKCDMARYSTKEVIT